ncbi:MAG: phosphopentomutase, partial [Bacillota bacterium]|nr:phosphopentomutase [Bacillota bacterium]
MKRCFVIVLDSVGIGATMDWQKYDEEPGNTLCHVAKAVDGLRLPIMARLGLGNIRSIKGVAPVCDPVGSWGKAPLTTKGKDTTAGHWEMMGILLEHPFPTFPRGFPDDLVKNLEDAFGLPIIGLKPASGTAIIEELGPEHLKSKAPIVYTSADSVLQIACHEDIYSHEELYKLCSKARSVCTGPYSVGRVIARPFTGEPGAFQRTAYRKDFSLIPPEPNVLKSLQEKAITVTGIGKISDIF